MKPVYTAKQIEDLIISGQSASALPADAILTPSAKDYLKELENPGFGTQQREHAFEEPSLPDYEFRWTPAMTPRPRVKSSTSFTRLRFTCSKSASVISANACGNAITPMVMVAI